MKPIAIFMAVMVTLLNGVATADNSQEAVGARPSALGGAFVGIADDGNALYWNPSGMAFLNHHEITTMYTDLFGIDINNSYLGYTYPITKKLAIGVDWFNLGFNDPELEYNFNKFNFGAAYLLDARFSIGGTLKYLNTNIDLDGRTVGSGNGWTGDLGVLFKPNNRFSAGLVLRNIGDGGITYDNGSDSKIYDMGLVGGVGVRPFKNALLTADIGDRLHLGIERMIYDILALRGGLQRDLKDEKETVLSFGFGIRYSPIQFDYSYTHYQHLEHTSRISAAVFFNFGRSLVTIENVELADGRGLFPALRENYAAVPSVKFDLINGSDKPLQCDWQLDLGPMSGAPTTGSIVLRAGDSKTIYAATQLSDRFSRNKSDAFATGEVKVSYASGRQSKSASRKFQAFVYGRGAIDWSAGVERVASFINPSDPGLREMASRFVDIGSETIDESSASVNIHMASAVLNGLRLTGVKYLADPNNPYAKARNQSNLVDNIQYPAELIDSRRGDCDDLTATYCTLLESIGIRTYVLDVPGHLFMMFDAGTPAAYRFALMLPDNLYVIHQGRVLIPVEVTAIEAGFKEAWIEGASEYYRWLDLDEINVIDLRSAWSSFPPAQAVMLAEAPEFNQGYCRVKMEEDRTALDELQTSYMASTYYQSIDELGTDPLVLNESAVRQVFEGNYEEGLRLLEKAHSIDPDRASIMMNLASTYSILGQHDKALRIIEQISPDSTSDGYCENHLTAELLALANGHFGEFLQFNPSDALKGRSCSDLSESERTYDILKECWANAEGSVNRVECAKNKLGRRNNDVEKSENVLKQREIKHLNKEVRLFQWF